MNLDRLDYRKLPGQNRLFLSYLFEPRAISSFYPIRPSGIEDLARFSEKVIKHPRISPRPVGRTLREFHLAIGADEQSLLNIEQLESESAVAIVTGQQVGIMGGPALTVYKALTALRLAADLTDSGIPAIPVFWLASQDSDFEEARSTYFFSSEGQIEEIRYPDLRQRHQQMVGTIQFGENPQLIRQVESLLKNFRGSGAGIDLIKNSYHQTNLRIAFARWLNGLFRESGLVIFDPLLDFGDLGDFYATAVNQREHLIETLNQRNEDLRESGFAGQVEVPTDETLLFLVEGDHRYKLSLKNGIVQARDYPRFECSVGELSRSLKNQDIQVGASALLRPILQDYLLPTLTTVGGPAEIAYFAQVNSITSFWQLETPILPRSGFTIIDRKSQRYLRRLNLTAQDVILQPRERLFELAMRQSDLKLILEEFDRTEEAWRLTLERLGRQIEEKDSSVASMLEKSSRKIFYQLNKNRKRLIMNQKGRDTAQSRQVRYLADQLFPKKRLQERVLNFSGFYESEGKPLLDQLLTKSDPFDRAHHLFYLR